MKAALRALRDNKMAAKLSYKAVEHSHRVTVIAQNNTSKSRLINEDSDIETTILELIIQLKKDV